MYRLSAATDTMATVISSPLPTGLSICPLNRTIYAGHKICKISVSSSPGRSLAPSAADWVVDLPPEGT